MKGKLIKISEEHFIIVDDSEIREGDWVYNSYKVDFATQIYQMPEHPIEGKWWDTDELLTTKKITHSTQALEPNNLYRRFEFIKIKPLSLSDVKELINEYNVEEIAKKKLPDDSQWQQRFDFIEGFKTHEELTKDKLFTIEDMEQMFGLGAANHANGKPSFKEAINTLLPKTEWDIIIDKNNKIRLV